MRRIALAALVSISMPLAAEVTVSDEHGFQVRHAADTTAGAAAAWNAMTGRIGEWWNPDHSWGGDPAKLSIRLEPGGCFCETLPDGGHAEHLRLLFFKPGERVVFDGTLGPLLTMPVSGRMIWDIEEKESGSRISFAYYVTGHPSAGLKDIAPAVDFVIGEQLGRLTALLAGE